MGRLSSWLSEWRETYEAYPAATVLNLGELFLAVVLLPAALVYPVFAGRSSWLVGMALVVVGAAFVVWFVALRSPVVDRLL